MNEHEKINYIELPSKDIALTKAFFEKTFNWSFEDFGPEYSAFSDAGINGGFFQSEQCSLTHNGAALIIFYSADLADTQAKIEAAGGSIIKAIFSFPGGRRFHFTEPCGSEFAVWSEAAGGE